MTLIEQFARRCAARSIRNGRPMLVTHGDPLLLAAFRTLGWDDPQPEWPDPVTDEAATVTAPERATLPDATGRPS